MTTAHIHEKRVGLYLRVSTSEQTTDKRRELMAVAERHGWAVVHVFEDAGISGAKSRKDRPALDALLKAVARREIDMVAAWSVDRLGRSLTDLLDFLRDLHAKDVDLFLHQQGLDTSTPSGRAMFQMMGVFAEFERAMIREGHVRVGAGARRRKAPWASAARRKEGGSYPPGARCWQRYQAHCPRSRRRCWHGVAGHWRKHGGARLKSSKRVPLFREALFRSFEYDARLRYREGEKRALWEMLSYCAAYHWTLPQWAAEAITDADSRSQKAELEIME